MMIPKRYLSILSALLFCLPVYTQTLSNPVLIGVADAGVLKYQGNYYIGGVRTDGDFYVSDDLVNWNKRIHAFSMDNQWTKGTGAKNNQIHANDMIYLNGTFHLYWSVNYWGKEKNIIHVAHAQSDNVEGPYNETDKTQWLENRIDPFIFKDDNGQLYMYMVKFTDGNTIWCRPMDSPNSFSAEPICLFSSLPDTWETLDNRVAEGPFVIKYRERYYLMYNANHTGVQWGNYQLGVAEADSPVSFNNGNKYSAPVVSSTIVDMKERYTDVLRYSKERYSPDFLYTMTEPASGWNDVIFNDTDWKEGESGFASSDYEGSIVCNKKTLWNSDCLWLRKRFSIGNKDNNYAFTIFNEGATDIYLNGGLIYHTDVAGFQNINLSEKDKSFMKSGDNILAVKTHKGIENRFDISLYDMDNDYAGDILFTPGQPNIVRGVNGFEWWLVYMGNKNMEKRSQYVDRIHFFGNRLVVDGMTSANSEGHHPLPSKPTFIAHDPKVGTLSKDMAAESYLFEISQCPGKNSALYAFYKDIKNNITIGIDSLSRSWYLESSVSGNISRRNFSLPSDFNYQVYHSWRIERNADNMKVYLDEIPAPGQYVFSDIQLVGKGVPGIKADDSSDKPKSLLYTIGFDDYNDKIYGWSPLYESSFKITQSGLKMTSLNSTIVKGDLSDSYEFSVQMSDFDGKGEAGFYPVYVDDNSSIKAFIDGTKRKLLLQQFNKGKTMMLSSISIDSLITLYPDCKYSDFLEKVFTFNSRVELDAILLPKQMDVNGLDKNLLSGDYKIEYRLDGMWHSIEDYDMESAYQYYNLRFKPLVADALRISAVNPEKRLPGLDKIRINSLLSSSYNFRVIRDKDLLYLFLDNKYLGKWNVDYKKSRIGLYSSNESPIYNGMLYFHK